VKGYINIYCYNNGRLHAGTGVYPSFDIAKDKSKHKPNYIATTKITHSLQEFRISPDGGGFYKK